MPKTFEHTFDHDSYKGKTSFSTGLFINGEVRLSSHRSADAPSGAEMKTDGPLRVSSSGSTAPMARLSSTFFVQSCV